MQQAASHPVKWEIVLIDSAMEVHRLKLRSRDPLDENGNVNRPRRRVVIDCSVARRELAADHMSRCGYYRKLFREKFAK